MISIRDFFWHQLGHLCWLSCKQFSKTPVPLICLKFLNAGQMLLPCIYGCNHNLEVSLYVYNNCTKIVPCHGRISLQAAYRIYTNTSKVVFVSSIQPDILKLIYFVLFCWNLPLQRNILLSFYASNLSQTNETEVLKTLCLFLCR